jgi:hypothetical protein
MHCDVTVLAAILARIVPIIGNHLPFVTGFAA